MLYNIIFFLKIKIFRKIVIKKIINFILTFKNYSCIIWSMNVTSILDCRQVVRQRVLIPSFVGSNPATPAKTDKSLEIATFSFIYKHLIWSVYSVFQKACFLALHGLRFQKILILQCFCLGISNFYIRDIKR